MSRINNLLIFFDIDRFAVRLEGLSPTYYSQKKTL